MKVSAPTQRRTLALFIIIAIFTLFCVLQTYFGIRNIDVNWRTGAGYSYIGMADTYYGHYTMDDDADKYAIPLQYDSEGNAVVEGFPTRLLICSNDSDYVMPDNAGRIRMSRIFYWISLAGMIATAVLAGIFLVRMITGFRSGNIFSRPGAVLIRISAVTWLIMSAAGKTAIALREYAIKEAFSGDSGIRLASVVTIDFMDIIPILVLLIAAEIISVATRLNEEESMTI